MKEIGVVYKQKGQFVTVRFDRKSACDHCRMCIKPKDKPFVELKLKNLVGARVGDSVEVCIGNGAMLKATLIVYLIPLAIAAVTLFVFVQLVTELMAILIMLFSLSGGFAIVSAIDKRIKDKKEYFPKITAIINDDNIQKTEVKNMNSKIIELDSNNFKQATGSSKLTLVDFFATWCMPCKMLATIIDELAAEVDDSIQICKMDVDNAEDIAKEFKIMSVPTMIFFKDGEVKERITGVRTKVQLLEILAKYK